MGKKTEKVSQKRSDKMPKKGASAVTQSHNPTRGKVIKIKGRELKKKKNARSSYFKDISVNGPKTLRDLQQIASSTRRFKY